MILRICLTYSVAHHLWWKIKYVFSDLFVVSWFSKWSPRLVFDLWSFIMWKINACVATKHELRKTSIHSGEETNTNHVLEAERS